MIRIQENCQRRKGFTPRLSKVESAVKTSLERRREKPCPAWSVSPLAVLHLEAEVQQKAAQLERSNKELEEFAYIASHDLQEPLRKVRAFGQRLEASAGVRLLEEEKNILKRMVNATERMQKMITDLLAYSRVNTQANTAEPVNLNTVLTDVLNDLEVRLEQSEGKVEVSSLPSIYGDSLQMRQLFLNLVGNGLKFHLPGVPPVVKVYPLAAERRTDQANGSSATIVVEDNGIGFDSSVATRLFQPFQRLVGRTQYEGSGIGLAICRKIVERYGGAITVQSSPGAGSRFFVTLKKCEDQ